RSGEGSNYLKARWRPAPWPILPLLKAYRRPAEPDRVSLPGGHRKLPHRAGTRSARPPMDPYATSGNLLGLNIEFFDQPLVFCIVPAEKLRELFGTAPYRLLGLLEEALADTSIGESPVDLGIEAGRDRWWRPRWHKNAVPLVDH